MLPGIFDYIVYFADHHIHHDIYSEANIAGSEDVNLDVSERQETDKSKTEYDFKFVFVIIMRTTIIITLNICFVSKEYLFPCQC